MKLHKNYIIKVSVLDDSQFFTSIISRQIENTMNYLSSSKGVDYHLSLYTHSGDFLQNYPESTDILFLDYYLDEGRDAIKVLERIDPFRNDIKVALMSQFENYQTAEKAISKGAMTFIQKDKKLLMNASDFVEYVVQSYF